MNGGRVVNVVDHCNTEHVGVEVRAALHGSVNSVLEVRGKFIDFLKFGGKFLIFENF